MTADNPTSKIAPDAEAGLKAMAALCDSTEVHSFIVHVGKGAVQVMRLDKVKPA
ncbi:hypothetical protein [Phaeobacter inhibens]|uniref:hypothetical protein n=1 Tax=Phaeobacter inhibens TaxID=221822 RepID=UPI0021A93E58|nr:hypothetical protein [Phaeobacter inhibens]UWR59120.1 hypothetical protein K4F88_09160 [Phaeobacter inhibens]